MCRRQRHFVLNLPEHLHSKAPGSHCDQLSALAVMRGRHVGVRVSSSPNHDNDGSIGSARKVAIARTHVGASAEVVSTTAVAAVAIAAVAETANTNAPVGAEQAYEGKVGGGH